MKYLVDRIKKLFGLLYKILIVLLSEHQCFKYHSVDDIELFIFHCFVEDVRVYYHD